MKKLNYKDELQELYKIYKGKDLEAALGVSVRSIQNYLKDENPSTPGDDVIDKIHEAFANYKEGKPLKSEATDDLIKSDARELAIYNLAESNRLIAASNADLAASNKELVNMVKDNFTANASQQIPQDVHTKLGKLLGFVALVGSGKRWKSLDEAMAVINSEIDAPENSRTSIGIRSSGHTVGK